MRSDCRIRKPAINKRAYLHIDMDLHCPQCNQSYRVPDDRLNDSAVYFICEKCGEQITLDNRGLRGVSMHDLRGAGDIFEGVRLSFNLKSIGISWIILLALAGIVVVAYPVVYYNRDIFSRYPALGAGGAFAALLLFLFVYDLLLYIVSKNSCHNIRNGRNITFSGMEHEFNHDVKYIIGISIALPAAFVIMLLPVGLLGSAWITYAGAVSAPLLILAVAIVFTQASKNFLYAYLVLRGGSGDFSLRSMARFILNENVNIVVYGVIIFIVSSAVLLTLLYFIMGGLLLAAGGILALGSGEAVSFSLSGLHAAAAVRSYLDGMMGAPVWTRIGLALFFFFSALASLLVLAYYICLNQALSVVAVSIMESNPSRSVNRGAAIFCLGCLLALGFAVFFFLI